MSPKGLITANKCYLLSLSGILTFLVRDLFFVENAEVTMAECQAVGLDTYFLGGRGLPWVISILYSQGHLCVHFLIVWFWEKPVTKQHFQIQAWDVHSHWVTHVRKALKLTSIRTSHYWPPPTPPNLNAFLLQKAPHFPLAQPPSVLSLAQSLCSVLRTSSAGLANLRSWRFHVYTNFSHPDFLPSIWNKFCFDWLCFFTSVFFFYY